MKVTTAVITCLVAVASALFGILTTIYTRGSTEGATLQRITELERRATAAEAKLDYEFGAWQKK